MIFWRLHLFISDGIVRSGQEKTTRSIKLGKAPFPACTLSIQTSLADLFVNLSNMIHFVQENRQELKAVELVWRKKYPFRKRAGHWEGAWRICTLMLLRR